MMMFLEDIMKDESNVALPEGLYKAFELKARRRSGGSKSSPCRLPDGWSARQIGHLMEKVEDDATTVHFESISNAHTCQFCMRLNSSCHSHEICFAELTQLS